MTRALVSLARQTGTTLDLHPDLTLKEWHALGQTLGKLERGVGWWIGEWWIYGDAAFGEAKAIVSAPSWTGPSYQTCVNAANCCRSFMSNRRRLLIPFTHHQEVASLPEAEADAILDEIEAEAKRTGKPTPTRAVRTMVKQRKRAAKEAALGDATRAASERIGEKLYGVIYADPPWRFEPYSRDTGMDRAADNHYPTMALDALLAMRVPAADDCVLFLWATAPMLPQALQVMDAWGFVYRSHCVWVKSKAGTGYWFRNRHELLLVGTRGNIPAPAPGEQYDSVIASDTSKHSEKPIGFAEMIEELYPTQAAIELFARRTRLGWTTWGNEAA